MVADSDEVDSMSVEDFDDDDFPQLVVVGGYIPPVWKKKKAWARVKWNCQALLDTKKDGDDGGECVWDGDDGDERYVESGHTRIGSNNRQV